MSEPMEPEKAGSGAEGGKSESGARDPRALLGEYPVQSKDIVPPADLAGEIWGADIESYPLRDREEDPRWATRTIWIWLVFALTCIGLIGTLLIYWAISD